jgi:hypothetical protein
MRNCKANSTKLLACTLLIAVLCAPLISMAFAASDDIRTQTLPDDITPSTEEEPILYASEENATTTSDDTPMLIQERDNSTATESDESSGIIEEDSQLNDDARLISGQTSADNTIAIIGAATIGLAIAAGAAVAVVRQSKK